MDVAVDTTNVTTRNDTSNVFHHSARVHPVVRISCVACGSVGLAAQWMRRLLAVSILATTAADPVLVQNGYCLGGKLLSTDKVSLADCESLSLASERSYFQFPVNETESGYCTGCPDDPAKFRLDGGLSLSIYRSLLPPSPPPLPPVP